MMRGTLFLPLPGVGDEDARQLVGRLGELRSFLFEEINLPRGNGFLKRSDDDLVRQAVADGKLWDHGHAEICGDHGEGGFELVTLESFLGLLELARFEGLISEAVSV